MTTSIDPSFTTETPVEPSWYFMEGVPGQGERPEWLPEKFKTMEDAAKSYTELEKKLGSAPKDYDLSKGESWIDADYAPFQEMMNLAKSKHVPQEVMDTMLDSVSKYLNEFSTDYTAEKAKLGPNADQRVEVIDNWAKANLSEASYNALTENLKTAESLIAIEEIRNKMNSSATTIPNSNQDIAPAIPSMQDIQSELNKNLAKYKSDPAYRRELQAKIELASKSSGFQDKQAY
jgi:hypothetical protein